MFKKLAIWVSTVILCALPLSGVALADTATNLITNPSVETAQNATTPDSWISGSWGTNNATFSYENTGHTGNHSLKTEISTYTNGAANWYYNSIPVTAGKTYEYSNWYQSNVDTEVDVELTMTDGSVQYAGLGTLFANPGWTQFSATYTVPTGVKSIAVFQILAKAGYLVTDDYSLAEYAPTPFNRPIVSVTFDDGWADQYINGRQILKDNGINATFYLISDMLKNGNGTEYMNATQAKDLFADGHEIASHTIDHCSMNGTTKSDSCPDPSTMTTEQATQFVTNEMQTSKNDIQSLVPGSAVNNFAYPYGEYSTLSTSIGQNYYTSQRTVECGPNTKDNLNLSQLKGCEVDATTSVAQIEGYIDSAIQQKSWLILFFHEVADNPVVTDDTTYTTKIADFKAIMEYIHSRQADIDNMTIAKAIATVTGSVTPPATKPGDLNGDGTVDALDLSTLLTNWNKTGQTAAQGDINGDGTVDALDLSTLLTNWSN